MAGSTHIPVNPEILRWAREEAGMSLDEAALKAKISDIKATSKTPAQSPGEHLGKIESGEAPLTSGNFKELAKLYRRPEITFFLSRPPRKSDFVADFRKIEGREPKKDSPEFAALKRRISCLHKGLREIADLNGSPRLSFVGSVRPTDSVSSIVERIHAILGEDPRKGKVKDEADFFRQLREQIQKAGVYVSLIGNLGSWHTNISLEEFRGICIADEKASIIIINPNDTVRARVFSLMHEFCHVLLGMSGVFNDLGVFELEHEKRHEQICNAVAAEYLVPEKILIEFFNKKDIDENVEEAAKFFRVSIFVIVRRLFDVGKISKDKYRELTNFYFKSIQNKPKKDSHPNPDVVMRSYLGEKLLQTLWEAAIDGQIDYTDASSLLGISATRLEKVCL